LSSDILYSDYGRVVILLLYGISHNVVHIGYVSHMKASGTGRTNTYATYIVQATFSRLTGADCWL